MNKYLKSLTDKVNIALWNEMDSSYSITLKESPEPNHIVNFRNDGEIILYINEDNLTTASFTHELLHIYLRHQGVNIVAELNDKIAKSEKLNYIFSHDLRDHIGNCLEHIKMLFIFIKYGYKNSDFIDDFYEPKMTDITLYNFSSVFKESGIYDRDAIDCYIGKFFGMKACNNKAFNYTKYYKALKELDLGLYNVLLRFSNSWVDYDVEKYDREYLIYLQNFIDELEDWTKNKMII